MQHGGAARYNHHADDHVEQDPCDEERSFSVKPFLGKAVELVFVESAFVVKAVTLHLFRHLLSGRWARDARGTLCKLVVHVTHRNRQFVGVNLPVLVLVNLIERAVANL